MNMCVSVLWCVWEYVVCSVCVHYVCAYSRALLYVGVCVPCTHVLGVRVQHAC